MRAMGFGSWFRGMFLTQSGKHAPKKPQLRRSTSTPTRSPTRSQQQPHTPSTPQRTRYSGKMGRAMDPMWTPSATATTNSSRSTRRRPKRPVSQAQALTPTPTPSHEIDQSNTPTPTQHSIAMAPLSRSASAPTPRPGRSATPSLYPRPNTPKPSHRPYRHMERELREASQTPDRSRSRKHSRHRSVGSIDSLPMKQNRMDRKVIKQVVSRVSDLFSHIPFVVSGLSAMVYYGFEGRRSTNVTILCPASSREAIRGWAKAKALQRFPDKPDQFGILTAEGGYRTLRVKYVDEGFEDLDTLRSESMKTSVLSLAGLANQLADGYIRELAVSNGRRQEGFATDMIWVLKRIASSKRAEHRLAPHRCPRIWDDTFWEPFTLSFPDSVPLFGAAGFGVEQAEELPAWDTREDMVALDYQDFQEQQFHETPHEERRRDRRERRERPLSYPYPRGIQRDLVMLSESNVRALSAGRTTRF